MEGEEQSTDTESEKPDEEEEQNEDENQPPVLPEKIPHVLDGKSFAMCGSRTTYYVKIFRCKRC